MAYTWGLLTTYIHWDDPPRISEEQSVFRPLWQVRRKDAKAVFSDTFGLVTSRRGSKPVLTGMSKKCPQVTRMMALWLKGVSFVQVVGCWVQPVSLKYAAFKEVTVHRMPVAEQIGMQG